MSLAAENEEFPILCETCLPEHDTRLLTDTGFLFLADIEERIAAGEEVLYACYDKSTQAIVYAPGRLRIAYTPGEDDPAAAPERWVDFTHAGTRRLWDDSNDDYGSTAPANGERDNRLTLRTTPEHEMLVQLCMHSGGTTYDSRVAGGAAIPPHTMPAVELAPGYQCSCAVAGRVCTHGYSHYRMYTGAPRGLHSPADVISLDNLRDLDDDESPIVALGLRFEDELDAFLELFGYWLGDGSMSHVTRTHPCDAVTFKPKKERDRPYLLGLLHRLHLRRGQHFTSSDGGVVLEVAVTDRRWFRFFDDEFGVKYRHSLHYDAQTALRKQGMHSSQRRPPAAAAVSASSGSGDSLSSMASRTRSGSGSCSVDLNRSISTSFTFTPRSCSTSAMSADSTDAIASAVSLTPMEDEEPPMYEEDEEGPVKSAKWLPHWALHRLDRRQLRLLIEGLRQADGRSAATAAQRQSAAAGGRAMEGLHAICTSGVGFRDQLIHACLHAGYSAYFKLNTRAGSVRGYNAVPYEGPDIYTPEEMEAALLADPTRQFKPERGRYDNWWVCYDEDVSVLLPAQDVRFDGSPCRIRPKREYKQGWVAVHALDGRVHQAVSQKALAMLLPSSADMVKAAARRGLKVSRVWRIFSAADYEAQSSGQDIPQQQQAATQPGDLYDEKRDGRVWCVEVEHDDHLIFAQRVHCAASGVVTKVGRSMIIGNCLGENPLIRMTKQSYARPCKICERPFTVYRWKPGPNARYKKTELCRTCAKLKNVCQTCVLDLQYGLPVQVRDSVLREEDRVDLPQSAVGRAFMIEHYERKMDAGVTASSSSSSDALFAPLDPSASSAATSALSTAYAKLTHKDATLSRLTRPAPYYKRNEAHLCTFFARGECNRGALCPYRHEMPPPPSALSQQNIKDRYAGRNDPVALKMLGRGRGGAVENGVLVAPEDPSVTTLWVGGVGGDGASAVDVEGEVARVFGAYGPLKGVRVLAEKRCAFVSFVSRPAAEDAAAKAGGECGEKGWTLRWAKAKAKADPTGDRGSGGYSGRGEGAGGGVLSADGAAAAPAHAAAPAVAPPLVFPSLPPPPGMSLTSYPSQHPQQSAARFHVDT